MTPEPPRGFRPANKLRRPAEFQRVYDRRCSVSDANLLVFAAANDHGRSRVGLSVSKKFGNAVKRNRYRRLFREAYRLTKAELPRTVDLILIPRTPVPPTLAELTQSLRKLVPAAVRKLERRP